MYFLIPSCPNAAGLCGELFESVLMTATLCHFLGLGACLSTCLQSPVERAFSPNVYVSDDERSQEDEYFNKCDRAECDAARRFLGQQALESDGERYHEQNFDIEQQKDDRDGVEFYREPVSCRSDRIFSALVRHQLCRCTLARADQLGDQQLADREPDGDDEHYADRGIVH